MEAIFIKLLNMSISGGWVILAVLLLRILLKKAPKNLRCCLWALAAIRLVCPISLESALSLIPSAEPIPQDIMYDTTPAIESGIEKVDNVINPILSASFSPNPGDSANPLQIILPIASLLWIAGSIVMLLYAFISCLRLSRRVAASIRLEDRLWICDNIKSPFIFGILLPRIYLPSGLKDAQLSCIVAHEKAHLKRHDHWWKPLGFLLLSIYWFNPLCWAAYILLCRDIELACDERVIKTMRAEEKKNYAETLFSCGIPRHMISACPLAFGEVSVKERIQTVLNYRKPSFWIAAAGFFVCAGSAVCLLTSPVTAAGDIFSSRYRVAEILYDAPWYDFTYTVENAPEYVFTADFELMERCADSPLGNSAWTMLGGFGAAEYSKSELYSLFGETENSSVNQNPGTPVTLFLSDNARKELDKVEKIWRADTLDENKRFYLAMETKDGEVLLAIGYGGEENAHIRWLWKMEGSAPLFSQEYLAEQIASMCGDEVNIFAVYESDTLTGKLLTGFQTINNHHLGFAVFNCTDSENSYSCSIKGYKTFPKDSLQFFTAGEEWGFEHSVTFVLSRIRNMSRLTVHCGDTLQETSPGSVTPAMIIFEWPELLSQEEADNIQLYYDTEDREGLALEAQKQTLNDAEGNIASENTPSVDGAPVTESTSSVEAYYGPLDAAVTSAIMEHCAAVPPYGSQPYDDSLFTCESHRILAPYAVTSSTASGSFPYLTGSSGLSQEITVCIMAMYQVYRVTPEGIQEITGRYFPALLTFSIPGDEDYEPGQTPITWSDTYILADFLEPDGVYTGNNRETYEDRIREIFSADAATESAWAFSQPDIAEEAIRLLTSQPDIDAHKQACYAQAVQYANIDTSVIIENLFETIMNASSGSDSNPYTYLTACPAEHFTLHYYGDYTLNYIISEFQKGNQTGLKGHLMAIIMEELTQVTFPDMSFTTGQDYFEAWQSQKK